MPATAQPTGSPNTKPNGLNLFKGPASPPPSQAGNRQMPANLEKIENF
jgi:hypothetical protein